MQAAFSKFYKTIHIDICCCKYCIVNYEISVFNCEWVCMEWEINWKKCHTNYKKIHLKKKMTKFLVTVYSISIADSNSLLNIFSVRTTSTKTFDDKQQHTVRSDYSTTSRVSLKFQTGMYGFIVITVFCKPGWHWKDCNLVSKYLNQHGARFIFLHSCNISCKRFVSNVLVL